MQIGSFLLAGQYPGQPQHEALERAVHAAVVSEQSGLAAVWLAEHHFVPYGVCPSAATLAGFLLGRTRRIGVGTAVSVLSSAHPVALGEQAALLHLVSGGRFTLGVGRGGPWVDLRVFGGGVEAYERGFPEALDLLLRWVRGGEAEVGASGKRYRFPPVAVVPAPPAPGDSLAGGPPVVVACTSPASVRLAAARGLPMLLGMHCGDAEKAEMTALWRSAACDAGLPPERISALAARHVSAGVAQVADSQREAAALLRRRLPGWLRQGLGAHRTVDGRARAMRDPEAYTELLSRLHAVGPPELCASRLRATAERTGIQRFALLVEGSGTLAETELNVRRLGSEVLPLLDPRPEVSDVGGAGAPWPLAEHGGEQAGVAAACWPSAGGDLVGAGRTVRLSGQSAVGWATPAGPAK